MRSFAAALLLVPLCLDGQNLSFGSRQARAEPEWVSRLTIYEVWLGAFSREGTIKGAEARLPYLADLGISLVYLGPIARISAQPHASPYNVADYNAVDPEFGTAADLKDFTARAHQLGLKVMLDIVYYHSAPDSVTIEQPDFFRRDAEGRIIRGFWPQPLPDFSNAAVRRYLIDSLAHWVRDFDVDGFRCDVAAGVPIGFWEEARKALDAVKPNVLLIAEADRFEDQLAAFDFNYNFHYYLTLRAVLRDGDPAIRIREEWEHTKSTFPRGARFLHYSDNHDWRRPVLEFGEKGSMAASVLNFTLDGAPMLYNGQEMGDCTRLRWRGPAPINWESAGTGADRQASAATLAKYKKLLRVRASEPALTQGELVWVNNTEPDNVLSFLRKSGSDEILVILNLSNRRVQVTLDLPVMDYYRVRSLLTGEDTSFELYSGRVSAKLAAFEEIVGKRIPHAPLDGK